MVFPTRLFLLRHGEVEERYHRVFGGRIDMDLSPRGHEQARTLAGFLRRRPIDAIYASPMRRAQQTLAPLASHCPKPAIARPEFREVDFGDWTGLTWEQVHSRYQISAFDWLEQIERGAIANAETGASFRTRVEPALRQIVCDHAGQSVAIVCHGGVVRMMLSILLDLPLPKLASFEIDYASVSQVERHERKTEVTLVNFAPWRDLP
jgi:broad specificity phosphatase PhoE